MVKGWHVWQGGIHGRGYTWWGDMGCEGVCVAGGVHGGVGVCVARGVCMAGDMHGRGHVWQGDMHAGEMATEAGGTHPVADPGFP